MDKRSTSNFHRSTSNIGRKRCRTLGVGFLISSKVIEPTLLGEPIHPVFFWNLPARHVLAHARLHCIEFGERSAARGRVARAVFCDEIAHDIGTLEHNASTRRSGSGVTEVL